MKRFRSGALTLLAVLVASSVPAMAMTEEASHDPHNLTWIVPHVLAVGGGGLDAGDLAYLQSQGFGAVADFRSDHDDGAGNVRAAGMDYLYLPEADASTITESDLEHFVAWAQKEAAAGKPMYIHCSNGWHRAPTFAIAYLMATQHVAFDDAAKRVKDAREGVLIRAPAPLLAYEAKLNGQDALDVKVSPDPIDVAPGSTTTLTIHVSSRGAPVAGASVHAWTEEPNLDAKLATDAAGAATVVYTAPSDAPMQHFFARASLPGHADGAANPNVMIEGVPSGGSHGFVHGAAFYAAIVGAGCALALGLAVWTRTRRARS